MLASDGIEFGPAGPEGACQFKFCTVYTKVCTSICNSAEIQNISRKRRDQLQYMRTIYICHYTPTTFIIHASLPVNKTKGLLDLEAIRTETTAILGSWKPRDKHRVEKSRKGESETTVLRVNRFVKETKTRKQNESTRLNHNLPTHKSVHTCDLLEHENRSNVSYGGGHRSLVSTAVSRCTASVYASYMMKVPVLVVSEYFAHACMSGFLCVDLERVAIDSFSHNRWRKSKGIQTVSKTCCIHSIEKRYTFSCFFTSPVFFLNPFSCT